MPALYADRPEETQRHLSYFAARMESRGEKELAWWRLGEVSQAVGRTVGAALALGVAVGAVRYLLEPVRVDLWGGGSSELPCGRRVRCWRCCPFSGSCSRCPPPRVASGGRRRLRASC
ncbi:hypothetical protein ACFQ0M_46160 [Kitasatospora aburaviensis]